MSEWEKPAGEPLQSRPGSPNPVRPVAAPAMIRCQPMRETAVVGRGGRSSVARPRKQRRVGMRQRLEFALFARGMRQQPALKGAQLREACCVVPHRFDEGVQPFWRCRRDRPVTLPFFHRRQPTAAPQCAPQPVLVARRPAPAQVRRFVSPASAAARPCSAVLATSTAPPVAHSIRPSHRRCPVQAPSAHSPAMRGAVIGSNARWKSAVLAFSGALQAC